MTTNIKDIQQHSFLSGRALILTHIIGWALVGVLLFLAIAGVKDIHEGLVRTAINLAFMVPLFYINARVFINRFFEKGRYGLLLGSSFLLVVIMAALRAYVEVNWLGGSIVGQQFPAANPWLRMFLVYSFSFILLAFFSSMYQLVENRNELALHHSQLEARHHEAQLQFLKAQINPHFLFNSLHNIYAAATVHHPHTPDMVLRLSDLLRYVTYDAQENEVALESEIAQIRGYIELYQWKSPHPLPVRFEIAGNISGLTIAPLLFLPLVENAFKHSNIEEEDTASPFIHIQLKYEANAGLEFEIANSYNPANQQKDSVGGVGLDNLRRRLALFYPEKSQIEINSGKVYTVKIHINTI